MAININEKSVRILKGLIRAGRIDTEESWSFTAADGNDMLGADGDNWENYANHHLAIDTDGNEDTKERYKYPVAKNGVIYRSGLIAAKQRAGAQDATNVLNAADELLQMVDEKSKLKWYEKVFNNLKEMFTKAHHMEEDDEMMEDDKVVNLKLPNYMTTALEKGLRLYEEGKGGDGLVAKTISEAKNMVESGTTTADKVIRASAWFARHASDRKPGWDKAGEETPGYVAYLLWASDSDDKGKAWWDRKRAEVATETDKQIGGFFVRKQADGKYRWFGIVTNKWIDLEGEILTDSAHVEFLNYLDENPHKAPELWTWHTPGTARKNRADWWEYANGFFMYSGELMPEEGKAYENVTLEPIGMSHGFFVLEKFGKYITKYRTFEVSELPLDVAANPYTLFNVEDLKEIKMAFSENKRRFIAERYGDEVVAQLEGSTEEAEKTLQDIGVDWKQLNAEYEAAIEEKLAERVQMAAEPQVATIVKNVVKALRDDLVALNERIANLDEQVKAALELDGKVNELVEKTNHLMETKDSWIAQAFEERNPFVDTPTKSVENIVSEEDVAEDIIKQAKEAAAKEAGWLKGMSPL